MPLISFHTDMLYGSADELTSYYEQQQHLDHHHHQRHHSHHARRQSSSCKSSHRRSASSSSARTSLSSKNRKKRPTFDEALSPLRDATHQKEQQLLLSSPSSASPSPLSSPLSYPAAQYPLSSPSQYETHSDIQPPAAAYVEVSEVKERTRKERKKKHRKSKSDRLSFTHNITTRNRSISTFRSPISTPTLQSLSSPSSPIPTYSYDENGCMSQVLGHDPFADDMDMPFINDIISPATPRAWDQKQHTVIEENSNDTLDDANHDATSTTPSLSNAEVDSVNMATVENMLNEFATDYEHDDDSVDISSISISTSASSDLSMDDSDAHQSPTDSTSYAEDVEYGFDRDADAEAAAVEAAAAADLQIMATRERQQSKWISSDAGHGDNTYRRRISAASQQIVKLQHRIERQRALSEMRVRGASAVNTNVNDSQQHSSTLSLCHDQQQETTYDNSNNSNNNDEEIQQLQQQLDQLQQQYNDLLQLNYVHELEAQYLANTVHELRAQSPSVPSHHNAASEVYPQSDSADALTLPVTVLSKETQSGVAVVQQCNDLSGQEVVEDDLEWHDNDSLLRKSVTVHMLSEVSLTQHATMDESSSAVPTIVADAGEHTNVNQSVDESNKHASVNGAAADAEPSNPLEEAYLMALSAMEGVLLENYQLKQSIADLQQRERASVNEGIQTEQYPYQEQEHWYEQKQEAALLTEVEVSPSEPQPTSSLQLPINLDEILQPQPTPTTVEEIDHQLQMLQLQLQQLQEQQQEELLGDMTEEFLYKVENEHEEGIGRGHSVAAPESAEDDSGPVSAAESNENEIQHYSVSQVDAGTAMSLDNLASEQTEYQPHHRRDARRHRRKSDHRSVESDTHLYLTSLITEITPKQAHPLLSSLIEEITPASTERNRSNAFISVYHYNHQQQQQAEEERYADVDSEIPVSDYEALFMSPEEAAQVEQRQSEARLEQVADARIESETHTQQEPLLTPLSLSTSITDIIGTQPLHASDTHYNHSYVEDSEELCDEMASAEPSYQSSITSCEETSESSGMAPVSAGSHQPPLQVETRAREFSVNFDAFFRQTAPSIASPTRTPGHDASPTSAGGSASSSSEQPAGYRQNGKKKSSHHRRVSSDMSGYASSTQPSSGSITHPSKHIQEAAQSYDKAQQHTNNSYNHMTESTGAPSKVQHHHARFKSSMPSSTLSRDQQRPTAYSTPPQVSSARAPPRPSRTHSCAHSQSQPHSRTQSYALSSHEPSHIQSRHHSTIVGDTAQHARTVSSPYNALSPCQAISSPPPSTYSSMSMSSPKPSMCNTMSMPTSSQPPSTYATMSTAMSASQPTMYNTMSTEMWPPQQSMYSTMSIPMHVPPPQQGFMTLHEKYAYETQLPLQLHLLQQQGLRQNQLYLRQQQQHSQSHSHSHSQAPPSQIYATLQQPLIEQNGKPSHLFPNEQHAIQQRAVTLYRGLAHTTYIGCEIEFTPAGERIAHVYPLSAAHRAGLQVGDVLPRQYIKVTYIKNDKQRKARRCRDLSSLPGNLKKGDLLSFMVQRQREFYNIKLKLKSNSLSANEVLYIKRIADGSVTIDREEQTFVAGVA